MEASGRARRRQGGASQRSILIGTGVAGLAALAVYAVVTGGGDAPGPQAPTPLERLPERRALPAPEEPAARDHADEEPTDEEAPIEVPPSDADVVLVTGVAAGPVHARDLPTDTPASIDLVLPITIEDAEVLATRIYAEGREPLVLEGAVRGPNREVVRLEVPPGWIEPGSYLIEVRTTERSHFPLRRFALVVD
jgi:hypothetical protein